MSHCTVHNDCSDTMDNVLLSIMLEDMICIVRHYNNYYVASVVSVTAKSYVYCMG